jgi:prepilin-type N-terminal cleavage/methylation domain-containing protein
MKQKNKIENFDAGAGLGVISLKRNASAGNGNKKNSQGFTLLEILLVVAIIAILAIIVIFAINPGRQLAQARNSQRRVAVNTILNAVYQYALDHQGDFPDTIPAAENVDSCLYNASHEICQTGASFCDVSLDTLTESGTYLISVPVDPSGTVNQGSDGNGYLIQKDSNNRLAVCAPKAELGETIYVAR